MTTSHFAWFTISLLVIIGAALASRVTRLEQQLLFDEHRIHRLELLLDGAIEQVDHAASDIDILETKIHDLRAGERGW